MGRVVRHSDNGELPKPVPVNNPGMYVARVVREDNKRDALGFVTMNNLPPDEVEAGEGSTVDITTSSEERIQTLVTQRAQRYKEHLVRSEPRYCISKIINTSVDTVEIGKMLGDEEPLEPMVGLVTESHVYVHTVDA
jgi:hypothetical protein